MTEKDGKRVKATFYFDPENLAALEAERLRRIGVGVARSEADLSDLLNEAVRKAFPKSGTPRAQARALRTSGTAGAQARALRTRR